MRVSLYWQAADQRRDIHAGKKALTVWETGN